MNTNGEIFMISKLLSLYENSILFHEQPNMLSEHLFHFFDATENEWIGIPKAAISETELQLLKALFVFVEEQPRAATSSAKNWYDFLLLDGPLPPNHEGSFFRFIQFQIIGESPNQMEVETALKGFFTDEVVIIWENINRGIVVEEKKQTSLAEEDFQIMLETMENDFYVKISFFIGKQHSLSEQLPSLFRQEKEFFSFAITRLGFPNIYTYERVFPAYLAAHLPLELKQKIIHVIFDLFNHDPEMFSTIKVFLENNSNASLAAKKLYIHRNTLQYRIDKFVEKTEIDLKDFYGAFTVFLACLLYEYEN
jgi:DNA-binding PucR family transcriptional regulator